MVRLVIWDAIEPVMTSYDVIADDVFPSDGLWFGSDAGC